MKEITIKPCPKCGRKPKVKKELNEYGLWRVQIQCKPFLQKRHLRSGASGGETLAETMRCAVDEWNRRADCANLPVW